MDLNSRSLVEQKTWTTTRLCTSLFKMTKKQNKKQMYIFLRRFIILNKNNIISSKIIKLVKIE